MVSLRQITKRVLGGGLIIGAVAGLAAAAAAAPAETTASEDLVNTEGSGEVRVAPDTFSVTVGAEAQYKSLDEARNEVNAKVQRIIQALKALNIRGIKLRTETLQIETITDNKKTPPVITGYNATNLVSVTVTGAAPSELGAQASRIVGAASRSGANRIEDLEFSLQNSAAARDQALKAAMNDAAHNARSIAETAGVRIIKLKSVDQRSFNQPSTPRYEAMMLAEERIGGAPRPPVEAGEVVVSSSVRASFVVAK